MDAPTRSIMSAMEVMEEEINRCFHRIETLEKSLKYRPMTNDEREKTEQDVAELKKILLCQENELQALRKSNRGSAVIAVLLIIAAFLIYGLYKMYLNSLNNNNRSPPQPTVTHLNW